MEGFRKRGRVIAFTAFVAVGILFLICRPFKVNENPAHLVAVLVLWALSVTAMALCAFLKFIPNIIYEISFCILGEIMGLWLMIYWQRPYMLLLVYMVQWGVVISFLRYSVIHLLALSQFLVIMSTTLFPSFDFVRSSYDVTGIPVFVIVFAATDWVVCQQTKNILQMAEENSEHERSLDDLLIIVEAKHNEAKIATRSKSQFLSNMSHEIRTPINAVLGMNEMILRESGEDTIKGYASDIKNSGELLLALVNDILDISKIEEGKMKLTKVEFGLMDIVRDVDRMIRTKMEDKNLSFSYEVDENLPSRYRGDDVRIRQILINLLSNAAKYTNEGSVWFTVSEVKGAPNRKLRFAVKDTGIGIKTEDIGKINEKFVRFDEEKNRFIEGSGLGITIVNGFLGLMGTELHVESTYGEGSEFSFEVEFEVADETPIREYTEKKEVDEEYSASFEAPDMKILVVDDNALNIKVFIGLLKGLKLQIDSAQSGMEAVELGRTTKYDLIFMDHMMPGMDGIETLKAMTEPFGSINAYTPFVALTANVVTGAKEIYSEAGFADFLAKPVKPSALEELIFSYRRKKS